MAQIRFKRGDSFSLSCTYKIDGIPTSVSAIDIDSQIRDNRGRLMQELTSTKLSGTGQFSLTATATETANWPVAALRCDIQFSENGLIRSTQTFDVLVVEDVTK